MFCEVEDDGVIWKMRESGDARRMFDEMPEDVITFTVMISSNSDQGLVEEADAVYSRVRYGFLDCNN